MPTLHVGYSEADCQRRIAQLPDVLSGRVRDATGAANLVWRKVGECLLEQIHDAFMKKSEGGTDAMGVKWPELSPATLLKRQGVSPAEFKARLKALPAHKQKQLKQRAGELARRQFARDPKARRAAMNDLDAKRQAGTLSVKQYRQKRDKLVKGDAPASLKKQALAGAFSMILRVTGDLERSLLANGKDNVLRVGRGWVEVGSTNPVMPYHDQRGGGGSGRLPRRQILPDGRIPEEWKAAIQQTIREVLQSREFWALYLGV